MARRANGDTVEPGIGEVADRRAPKLGQDQGQRPRPECSGQLIGQVGPCHERLRHRNTGDMGDQRIEAWPALGGIEPGDRCGIIGIGREAVNGLGRHAHKATLAQDRGGAGNGVRAVGRQDGCGHGFVLAPARAARQAYSAASASICSTSVTFAAVVPQPGAPTP